MHRWQCCGCKQSLVLQKLVNLLLSFQCNCEVKSLCSRQENAYKVWLLEKIDFFRKFGIQTILQCNICLFRCATHSRSCTVQYSFSLVEPLMLIVLYHALQQVVCLQNLQHTLYSCQQELIGWCQIRRIWQVPQHWD